MLCCRIMAMCAWTSWIMAWASASRACSSLFSVDRASRACRAQQLRIHSHTVNSSTHTQSTAKLTLNSSTHTQSTAKLTHSQQLHSHTVNSSTHTQSTDSHTVNSSTHTVNSSTHTQSTAPLTHSQQLRPHTVNNSAHTQTGAEEATLTSSARCSRSLIIAAAIHLQVVTRSTGSLRVLLFG